MELISRDNARAQGLKVFVTSKPCKRGHLEGRYVSNNVCVSCKKVMGIKWVEENKLKVKDYLFNYHKKRKENETEEERLKSIQATRRWQIKNKDRVNAKVSLRQATKIHRTPAWADKDEIAKFYKLSTKLTRYTGIVHHVDHIIPLQGEFVSGLHVPDNLRVIPALENLQKSNKFNIEEYPCQN